MPILRVVKNEMHLCTVGSDDVWMFSAGVRGQAWGPEASFLDVSGGSKRDPGGGSDFLIWEMPHELTKLDRITFHFEEGSRSAPKPRKFDPDAYSPEEPKKDWSFPPTEEALAEFEARPPINRGLLWLFSMNGGRSIEVAPDLTRQHLSLRLLWNEDRPERLRINLSKSSLREIVHRAGGEKLFLEYVPVGSSVEIAIGAADFNFSHQI